jgi:hypothetical protein
MSMLFHDADNIVAQIRRGQEGMWHWRVYNKTRQKLITEGVTMLRSQAIERATMYQAEASAASGQWVTIS